MCVPFNNNRSFRNDQAGAKSNLGTELKTKIKNKYFRSRSRSFPEEHASALLNREMIAAYLEPSKLKSTAREIMISHVAMQLKCFVYSNDLI